MSKAILISIKPKWVAKILNGEKTIEIRKTMPKCDLPIDVYIYCTKDKPFLAHATHLLTGKYSCIFNDDISYKEHNINGKVVAKFTLNKVEEITPQIFTATKEHKILVKSCLKECELFDYISKHDGTPDNPFYVWHIDDLEIFDKPKELCEFNHWTDKKIQWYSVGEKVKVMVSLTNAPQNYCYVEIGK